MFTSHNYRSFNIELQLNTVSFAPANMKRHSRPAVVIEYWQLSGAHFLFAFFLVSLRAVEFLDVFAHTYTHTYVRLCQSDEENRQSHLISCDPQRKDNTLIASFGDNGNFRAVHGVSVNNAKYCRGGRMSSASSKLLTHSTTNINRWATD